ncbi:MAG: hypothetical protein QNK23_00485 [Crocinitomicaceae bacterium]|nr:hypothetical protein [Crocinitomicaceae bacterium]
MSKIIGVVFCTLLLFSCKKEQTPAPCEGICMSGERDFFVGTWHWYSTTVEEWFDLGSSVYHDYTPVTEGFNYYFTISNDGIYRGYENSTLVHEKILSSVEYENFNTANVIQLGMNCTGESISLSNALYLSSDSIRTVSYPLNFDDQENHLRTLYNYFVRE